MNKICILLRDRQPRFDGHLASSRFVCGPDELRNRRRHRNGIRNRLGACKWQRSSKCQQTATQATPSSVFPMDRYLDATRVELVASSWKRPAKRDGCSKEHRPSRWRLHENCIIGSRIFVFSLRASRPLAAAQPIRYQKFAVFRFR